MFTLGGRISGMRGGKSAKSESAQKALRVARSGIWRCSFAGPFHVDNDLVKDGWNEGARQGYKGVSAAVSRRIVKVVLPESVLGDEAGDRDL